jgi:hypothetical protein
MNSQHGSITSQESEEQCRERHPLELGLRLELKHPSYHSIHHSSKVPRLFHEKKGEAKEYLEIWSEKASGSGSCSERLGSTTAARTSTPCFATPDTRLWPKATRTGAQQRPRSSTLQQSIEQQQCPPEKPCSMSFSFSKHSKSEHWDLLYQSNQTVLKSSTLTVSQTLVKNQGRMVGTTSKMVLRLREASSSSLREWHIHELKLLLHPLVSVQGMSSVPREEE